MIGVVGPKDLNTINQLRMEGVDIIITTSNSTCWSRGLSPFFLGPVSLYNGNTAQTVENAWQYCKVYPCHIDSNGNPDDSYWEWAKKGWSKKTATRYPMGKGEKPLYSLWEGNKLSYVDARKKIYLPLYIKAVIPTEAFKKLKRIYQKTPKIYLWDFDGYDYLSLGKTLKEVLNDPNKKMGHAFVLAMLLTLTKNEILALMDER